MPTYTPSPGILETVVTEESLLKKDVSTHASRGKDVPALSKQAMKAYRRAKKVGKARDARSRLICVELRSKREGTPIPFDDVTPVAPKDEVQTLLSDF